jgi:hypothetical protein
LSGEQAATRTAGEDGEARFAALPKGRYSVTVSKQGYDGNSAAVQLGCGENKSVELKLRVRPTILRLRTTPPHCEILIDGQSRGQSDAQGAFSLQVTDAALKLEARKEGYLGVTKGLLLEPGRQEPEIVLALKPIPALLTVAVTPDSLKDSAKVRVDQQTERRAANEEIALAPGPHQLTIEALGHKTATLEVNLPPGAKERREVKLARLALTELAQQAEAAFQARAYANVMKLCNYMFEAEANNATAHRLAGLTYLADQNYAAAESHLTRAIAGGETITLAVRRHLREDFYLDRGHDQCQARLSISKDAVVFRGLQVAAEDFNVARSQVQLTGLQLRRNAVSCSGVKVTLPDKRKRDYCFFAPDQELTNSHKALLEMLQRLLQPN